MENTDKIIDTVAETIQEVKNIEQDAIALLKSFGWVIKKPQPEGAKEVVHYDQTTPVIVAEKTKLLMEAGYEIYFYHGNGPENKAMLSKLPNPYVVEKNK